MWGAGSWGWMSSDWVRGARGGRWACRADAGRLKWCIHRRLSPKTEASAAPHLLGTCSMIKDVIRFGREAPEVLRPENDAEVGGAAVSGWGWVGLRDSSSSSVCLLAGGWN